MQTLECCLITPSCDRLHPLLGSGSILRIVVHRSDPSQSKPLQSWRGPANNTSVAAHLPLRTAGTHHIQKISIRKCERHTRTYIYTDAKRDVKQDRWFFIDAHTFSMGLRSGLKAGVFH